MVCIYSGMFLFVSTVHALTIHVPARSERSSEGLLRRRAVAELLLKSGAMHSLFSASASSALFESPTQLAVSAVAIAHTKLLRMVAEVTEVSRKRTKMAPDAEDDAYLFRFARAVLDPASASISEAAPSLALVCFTMELAIFACLA